MKRLLVWIGMVFLAGAWSACERPDHMGALSISVSSDMTCKSTGPLKSNDPAPETSCIKYSYDGDSLLTMVHYNAGFNCCPESFIVDIELKGDSLIIREDDAKHGCKCNCLYDLDLSVRNLRSGTYHVKIVESSANAGWPQLVFDMDLALRPIGEFCVTRNEGWWR